MPRMRDRLAYAAAAARAVAKDPFEGVERTLERVAEYPDTRRGPRRPATDRDWKPHLHDQLGAPWPCALCEELGDVWSRTADTLSARGLDVGRGAFGGWDDADPGLAWMVWALVRHLRPERVVETGVGRGITTAVILEGLERNGAGRLWSIDLPPLLEQDLAGETGAAVPSDARGRWTLLRGSSRRLLPGLMAGLGEIDVFVHDSMHTARNVRFELDRAWPRLREGGAAVVDDIERNPAFEAFAETHADARATACTADDRRAYFGWLLKIR